MLDASHSGYQRLEHRGTVLLFDVGGAPPIGVSQAAHAGFLAFEMSGASHRFILNCGNADDPRWSQAARTTAAHSTLTVEDTSAARFLNTGALRRRYGPLILSGPRAVTAERHERADATTVTASHDAYRPGFGLLHERTLSLSADGNVITGLDRLIATGKTRGHDRFAIRFHLHPAIRANRTSGGDILLVAPDGEAWVFTTPLIDPEIAESVYLSDVHGRRRTAQIVVEGRASVTPEVSWTLARTAQGSRARPARGRPPGGAGLFD